MRTIVFLCVVSGAVVFAQSSTESPTALWKNPEVLCGALQSEGINTGPWRSMSHDYETNDRSPFSCESPETVPHVYDPKKPPDAPKPLPEMSIIYRVSGDTRKRADYISLSVTVRNDTIVKAGKVRLNELVTKLLKSLHLDEPAGLSQSMKNNLSYRSRQPYGIAFFDLVTHERKPNEKVLRFRLREP